MHWPFLLVQKLVGFSFLYRRFVSLQFFLFYLAAEVLSSNMPFVVMKPLTEATSDSRAKAKKCSSSLQPYRQRPETCAALARRLVTGALGVKLKTSPEELANERRVLREAKGSLYSFLWASSFLKEKMILFIERKLLAAKLRDEAWES